MKKLLVLLLVLPVYGLTQNCQVIDSATFNSTAISKAKHYTCKLEIQFTSSNKWYTYPALSRESWETFIKCNSVGKYFNKFIRIELESNAN